MSGQEARSAASPPVTPPPKPLDARSAAQDQEFEREDAEVRALSEDDDHEPTAQGQDVPTNCPFCGWGDLEDWQAELLHDAHGQIEELSLAKNGSEEFNRLLASVAAFVGVERV